MESQPENLKIRYFLWNQIFSTCAGVGWPRPSQRKTSAALGQWLGKVGQDLGGDFAVAALGLGNAGDREPSGGRAGAAAG